MWRSAIAAVVAYVLLNPSHDSSRLVLAPASVPPVVDECDHSLQIGADGNISPLTCDGKLNVRAWQHLARENLLVLSLGADVLPSQVLQAMCSDLPNTTKPIEVSVYDMAKLYYGWRFGLNPRKQFLEVIAERDPVASDLHVDAAPGLAVDQPPPVPAAGRVFGEDHIAGPPP